MAGQDRGVAGARGGPAARGVAGVSGVGGGGGALPGDPSSSGGHPLDDDAAVFVISVAAELAGMHPQTLRQYDRLGLVSPQRTTGRGRRYSPRDIAQLREVQRLSQEEGMNLEGVRRVLELGDQVAALQQRVVELDEENAQLREALRRLVGRPGAPDDGPRALPPGSPQDGRRRRRARRELVPVSRGAMVVWTRSDD